MRKTEIFAKIAEDTELTRKQIAAVFESLGDLMHRHLKSVVLVSSQFQV